MTRNNRWLKRRTRSESPVVHIETPIVKIPEQPKTMIRANWVMAGSSVAMLGVAVATGVVSALQWDAMEKQNDQTEIVLRQMRLEQRAWVTVLNSGFDNVELGKPLRWKINIGNSGQTPAFVDKIEWSIDRKRKDADFDPSENTKVNMLNLQQSLAPGATPTAIPFQVANVIVNQELLEFTKNGNPRDVIYIFGVVHYEGVAGEKRRTEFCFATEEGSERLSFHHKHNRMY